jgi:DNA-binding transcriptional MerR regulator
MGEYKIKDIETLTGIKSHTIRIWEKRYGILKPTRTSTKIRTYTDTDLTEILNVAILNKNGWKISHISELKSSERKTKVLDIETNKKGDIHFEKLLLSLIEMDESGFHRVLNLLIEEHGIEVTFSIHLANFLERIGIMWITDTINPAQEHFISHLIRQKIISATDSLPVPNVDGPKVLLFLPEHEWHELSLLFYHYVLRSRGVHSFYLGQSLPYDALLEAVKLMKPKAVLTSVLTLATEEYYFDLFKKMKSDLGDIPIFASGYQIKVDEEKLKEFITPVYSVDDIQPLLKIK